MCRGVAPLSIATASHLVSMALQHNRLNEITAFSVDCVVYIFNWQVDECVNRIASRRGKTAMSRTTSQSHPVHIHGLNFII